MRVSDEQVKCSGVARATMQPPSSSSRPLGRSITARLPSGVDTSHTKFTCLGAAAGGWAVTWAVIGDALGELRAILVAQLVVPDDLPDQPVQQRYARLAAWHRDAVQLRAGMMGALLRRQAGCPTRSLEAGPGCAG